MRIIKNETRALLDTPMCLINRLVVQVQWVKAWVEYTPLLISDISESVTDLNKTIGTVNVTIDSVITGQYHKRPARVVLRLSTEDVILFQGQVNSPFDIKEKSTSFDIVNEIETEEVGFSPEDGQLDWVPLAYRETVWPLGFGVVKHAPAVKVREPRSMKLLTTLTLVDPTLQYKYEQAWLYHNGLAIQRAFLRETAQQNEDLVGTLGQDLVDQILEARSRLSAIQTAQTALELAESTLQATPSQANQTAVTDAEDDLKDAMDAGATAVPDLETMTRRVGELMEKFKYRKEATRRQLQLYTQQRQIRAQIADIEEKLCKQLQNASGNQMVEESSEFEQNELMYFWINDTKFQGYVSGQDLYLQSGPLNNEENITLDPWSTDENGLCDSYESLGMVRCPVVVTGQWMLVRDNIDRKHILKIVRQEDDKLFFELVKWSDARTTILDRLDIDSVLGRVVDLPPGPPITSWPNPAILTGGLDPSLYNRRETQRYFELVTQIADPTEEEKLLLARIAYLEPYDGIADANVAPYFPSITDMYTVIGENIEEIEATCGTINPDWFDGNEFAFEEIPESIDWSASPGTAVYEENRCIVWCVNTLPSTVHAVHAYRTVLGNKFLSPIPSRWYIKEEDYNLGTMDCTFIVMKRPVPGFEEQPYVTYTSSIGPRMVDILKFLIENYTDRKWDAITFNEIESRFQDKYPLNFVVTQRTDVLQLMHRITWESRCRIYITNKFKLLYLSSRPESVANITTGTIVANTRVQHSMTTEDVVTKFVGVWTPSYLPEVKPIREIIRYNIRRYGVSETEETFTTLDTQSVVSKTSYFWAIRRSNMFKKLTVEVTHTHMNIQINDLVTFNGLPAMVVGTRFSLDKVELDLEFPIRIGETTIYPYYWPSDLESDVPYPPPLDTYFGGLGRNAGVTGDMPCPSS